ncbi:MAG: radical SAM protein [Anaerolineae bacterium]|nr:radical SAM protein [Anaerolineae bacterium]
MIIEITRSNHDSIKNPAFAQYAEIYLQIYDNLLEQIEATGLSIDEHDDSAAIAARREVLRQKGANFRNGDRSIYVNAISPSCVACQTGVDSQTFFISLKCHRDCYFCFNPNQQDYEFYLDNKRDLIAEINGLHASGVTLKHLAVTGGEPLLYPEELLAFYRHARTLFPDVYMRLYTSGDQLTPELLQDLRDAGLEEIRFSVRAHDSEKAQRHTLDRMALAKQVIPEVMVEMPVVPGTGEWMRELLLKLDELKIASINLLEFCYPFANPDAFKERGFKIRHRPYQVPYDYWYAGGLPIAGSELLCLELMEFAIDRGLNIGVHYCSLENKFTAQVYEQNADKGVPEILQLSQNGYYFRSAKVFGADVPVVLRKLERKSKRGYQYNKQYDYLEFHVNDVRLLRGMDIEVGITTSVVETRERDAYVRELKIDLTTPKTFKVPADL